MRFDVREYEIKQDCIKTLYFYRGKIGSAFQGLLFQSKAKYSKITRNIRKNNIQTISWLSTIFFKKFIKGYITSCNYHKKSRYLLKNITKNVVNASHANHTQNVANTSCPFPHF